jgi:hypothetical protein
MTVIARNRAVHNAFVLVVTPQALFCLDRAMGSRCKEDYAYNDA